MVLESKPAPMMLMYAGGIAVGALIMYLARDYSSARSNEFAGFLLGCMVLGLSLVALVLGESRRVELDEAGRRVILDVCWRWGRRKRLVIPFADIRDFGIGALGSATDGSRYYDIVVNHRDGREIHLFGGCAFEGRLDRDRIEGLRDTFSRAVQ